MEDSFWRNSVERERRMRAELRFYRIVIFLLGVIGAISLAGGLK